MASVDKGVTGKITYKNSGGILKETYSNNYYVLYSFNPTGGTGSARTSATKHLDHYAYTWYYKNPNGVWWEGQSGTTKDTKLSYSPPSNAIAIKVKIKAVAKKFKDSKNKKNEISYWTSGGYFWSDAKKLRDVLNPPSLSVELSDVLEGANNLETAPTRTLDVTITVDTTNLKLTAGHPEEATWAKWHPTPAIWVRLTNIDRDQTLGVFAYEVPDKYNPVMRRLISNLNNGQVLPNGTHIGIQARLVQGDRKYAIYDKNIDQVVYSDYCEQQVVLTRPDPPVINSAVAVKDYVNGELTVSAQVDWNSVLTATSYTLYWSKNKKYFNYAEGQVESSESQSTYQIAFLEAGSAYWFRVKATNASGDSAYSAIFPNDNVGLVVGIPPAPPTTWSSTTKTILGSDLYLYWVHNSKDGSSETAARIQIWKEGVDTDLNNLLLDKVQPNDKINDDEHKNDTKFYSVDTLALNQTAGGDLTSIFWRIQTRGVSDEYSEWSIVRKIDIFEPPTLSLVLSQEDGGNGVETITAFPFYLKGETGPATQVPIGYSVEIRSINGYTTINDLGEEVAIPENGIIFNRFYDTNEILNLEFTPSMIDLEPQKSYRIFVSAAMNSGLTATNSANPIEFNVNWTDSIYEPYLEVEYDDSNYTTSLTPVCYPPGYRYVKAIETDDGWELLEDNILDLPIAFNSESLETYSIPYDEQPEDFEIYYYPLNDVYFSQIVHYSDDLIDNVTLSIYRKNYDGSFTEIGSDIENNRTSIVDPHPSLDYARYRVVATDKNTGAISWYDPPPTSIQEKSLIIQWDESRDSYVESTPYILQSTDSDPTLDEYSPEEGIPEDSGPSWTGSLLKLPFNIDLSSNYNPDVSHIEYSGRSHPVAYYGTQVGETASWSTDIAKSDSETLYLLRKLAIYMGNVYVREPYGSGYWATINVSFSQTHREMITPVSLDVTRVDSQEI